MKKSLSLLAVLTLTSSTVPKFTQIFSNINLINKIQLQTHNINEHDKFSKMDGTEGNIMSLITIKTKTNIDIYAGSNNGKLYRSSKGGKFKIIKTMESNTYAIKAMISTSDQTIYFAKTGIFKEKKQEIFGTRIYKSKGAYRCCL